MNVILPTDDFQDVTFESMEIPFAQVSKYVLSDRSISMEAKGLYAQIEMFYQQGKDLNKINFYDCFGFGTSKNKFDVKWNELKEKGYLQRFPINSI